MTYIIVGNVSHSEKFNKYKTAGLKTFNLKILKTVPFLCLKNLL